MTSGSQVSQAIHVAATLGIADLLKDGSRTKWGRSLSSRPSWDSKAGGSKEREMKQYAFTSKVGRIAVAVAIAGVLAPAAFAKGGAVSHVYAPPPLDAGSAVPNPDYASGVRIGSARPDDRASRATVHGTQQPVAVIARATGDGFDWGDTGRGAAGVFT